MSSSSSSFPSFRTQRNLSVADLYDLNSFHACQVFLAVLLFLYTVLLPPTLYIVSTQSALLKPICRGLIFFQLLVGYVFALFKLLFLPLRFHELQQFCYCGWLKLPAAVAIYIHPLGSVMVNTVALVQMVLIVYRVLYMLSSGTQTRLMETKLVVAPIVAGELLLFGTMLYIPAFVDLIVDQQQVQALISAEVPAMRKVYRLFPETIGFHPKLTKGGYAWYLRFVQFFALFPVLLIAFLAWWFWYRMRRSQKYREMPSYRLQKVMLKILSVQMSFLILLVFLPLISNVRAVGRLFPPLLGDCLVTLQLLVDILTTLLGVTDFRRFLTHDCVSRLRSLFSTPSGSSVAPTKSIQKPDSNDTLTTKI